jgi:hypothetical protein
MPRPGRPKKKPPIEISDNESISTSTFSALLPSPGLFGTGEKRGHSQSSTEKENQKPVKKMMTFTAGIHNISFSPLSPKQHLQKALDSLTQAYKGLKEEKEKEEKEEKENKKEQVKQLEDYTSSVLAGENLFIKGKEKTNDVLKGLVEEVRALRKEVAPTKETYAERLKKNLPTSSFLPSSSLPFPTTSTSTISKKKQLQERKLVLITDQKDQPLDTFSIRNKVNQLFVSKLQVEKPVLASIARTL